MILDSYLLPVAEFSVSIAIPLILTLKTLEITNKASTSSKDTNYFTHILRYWLTYWFLLCFIQYIGINNHVRSCFSFFYMAQYRSISPYLVDLYQSTLIPQISGFCLKLFNINISEEDVDRYSINLLEQICFNDRIFDKIFSLLRLGKSSSWSLEKTFIKSSNSRKSSNVQQSSNHKSTHRVLSGDNLHSISQNIVPLEIQKPRTRKSSVTKTVSNATYDSNLDPKKIKKRSSDNLRSKSSSSSLNGQASGSQSWNQSRSISSRHVSNEDFDKNQMENIPTIDDIAYSISTSTDPVTNSFAHPNANDQLSPSSTYSTVLSPQRNDNKTTHERASKLKGLFV